MTGICILGAGVEGCAAIGYFLRHTDYHVHVVDRRVGLTSADLGFAAASDRVSVATEESWRAAPAPTGLLLRSPGIPPTHGIVAAALAKGMQVTTPTGYWLAHHAPSSTITVTGTKGKSTSVAVLAHLLSSLGTDSRAMGNIGAPPLSAELSDCSRPVIELSSYMMHDLPLQGHYHVVTNLYREHTTWHGSEAAYRAAKLRPFREVPQSRGMSIRTLIDEEGLAPVADAAEDAVTLRGNTLHFADSFFAPAELNPLFASIGALHSLRMAIAVAISLGHDPAAISGAVTAELPNFRGLPHRQCQVPSSDGRVWIDDALATVPEAVQLAIVRFADRPLTLLLGGIDRAQSYENFARFVAAFPTVRVVTFGAVADLASRALLANGVEVTQVADFDAALDIAPSLTPTGGIVLFSPAAASEPPYANYQARGAAFAAAASRAR